MASAARESISIDPTGALEFGANFAETTSLY